MSDTEDLTGPYIDEDGNAIIVIAPCLVDRCWIDDGDYHRSAGAIAHWARVPEKAEPAEDVPCDCSTCSYGRAHLAMYPNRKPAVPEPIKPSDVHDGDLLTGALYGNPFTDWLVKARGGAGGRDLYFGSICVASGWPKGDEDWQPKVTVTARKPAPSPPLPWVEHPEAWWRSSKDGWISPSATMGTAREPAGWQRVAVIPWDLIEKLRGVRWDAAGNKVPEVQAILDAADGAK